MPGKAIRLKTLNKIVSILLVLVFMFNVMGYYFVFEVNRSILRKNIRGMINSGLNREMIVTVVVDNPETNLNFKKLDQNEFSYFGRLYDIVTKTVKGNVTWFYCINDKHEERLIAGFEKINSGVSGSAASSRSGQLLAMLHNIITLALLNDQDDLITPGRRAVSIPVISVSPGETFLAILSPPPEFS